MLDQNVLITLQQALVQGLVDLPVIVDYVTNSESSMQEEQRIQTRFFCEILPLLQSKYPALIGNSSATANAENAAIISLINYIKQELVKTRDRLGNIVGEEEATRAINEASKRNSGTLSQSYGCSFDDIGRYHTALRALFVDSNVSGLFREPYLKETQTFTIWRRDSAGHSIEEKHTYRRMLAYIWLGASEDDIKTPAYCEGIPLEDLQKMSKEAVVTELAQNRREHNFDEPFGYESPLDFQTCSIGFRGRMFGRMLMYNDRYMITHAEFNLSALREVIRQNILDCLTTLSLEERAKTLTYLDDYFVSMLGETHEANQNAMSSFIARIKEEGMPALLSAIHNDLRFAKIKSCIEQINRDHLDRAKTDIDHCLRELINMEAESLRYGSAHLIGADFLIAIANSGLRSIFEQRLAAGTGPALNELSSLERRLNRRLCTLTMLVESEVLRRELFPEYKKTRFSDFMIEKLRRDLNDHIAMCKELDTMSCQLIDRVGTPVQSTLVATFVVGSMFGQHTLTEAQARHLNEMVSKTRDFKAAFERMQEQTVLATINETFFVMRPDVSAMFNTPQASPVALQSPITYARYIWALLSEKTLAGHYYISDNPERQDEVDHLFSCIFGNQNLGLSGISEAERNVFLFALNKEQENASDALQARWVVLKEKLKKQYNIQLEQGLHVPSNNVITLSEIAYSYHLLPLDATQILFDEAPLCEALCHYSGAEGFLVNIIPNHHRPFFLLNLASKLPLFATKIGATEEKLSLAPESGETQLLPPLQVQQDLINCWKQVAKRIYECFPPQTRDLALTTFVVNTIMSNLQILKFSREDNEVISNIIGTYLGTQACNYNTFPLPFTTRSLTQTIIAASNLEQRINNLANHLTIMLTTLTSPILKYAFAAGNLRLLSRQHSAELAQRNNCYVLRLSNLNPSLPVLTFRIKNPTTNLFEFQSVYFNATRQNQYKVNDAWYSFPLLSQNELANWVRTQCDDLPALNPNLSLDVISSSEYQQQENDSYIRYHSPLDDQSESSDDSLPFATTQAATLPRAERQCATIHEYRQTAWLTFLAQRRTSIVSADNCRRASCAEEPLEEDESTDYESAESYPDFDSESFSEPELESQLEPDYGLFF